MSLSDTNPNVLDLCRLCLGKDERLIPVFDNLHTNQVLCDKINVCLAIQISSEDRISQKICTSCYIKVDSFYEFRNTSSESQRVLERWLQNTENTLTDLNPQEANNIIKDGNSLFIDDVTSDEESDDRDSLSDGDNNLNPVETSESLQLIQENDELPSVSNDDLITLLPATNEDPGPSGLHSTDTVALIEEHRFETSNTNDEKKNPEKLCKHCCIEFKSPNLLKKHIKEAHSMFACYCGAKFVSLKYLNRHQARHNATPTIPCKLCNKVFITMSELKDHQKSHRLGEQIFCHICNYVTLYKSNMVRHLKRHNKEYSVFCDKCSDGFFSKDELDTHHIKKHDAIPFFCGICRKSFTSKSYFYEHNKTAHWTTSKDFLCETCGKAFKTKNATRKHMKIHMGLRYSCHICNKSVNSPYSLKKHIKAHMGEKNVICYICGKAFVDNKYIAAHLRSHTGERPYGCKECGKRFTQATTLKVHLRYHTGERPYICTFCGIGFITNTLLTNHMKMHISNYLSNGIKN